LKKKRNEKSFFSSAARTNIKQGKFSLLLKLALEKTRCATAIEILANYTMISNATAIEILCKSGTIYIPLP
jgi:hypothetical protein